MPQWSGPHQGPPSTSGSHGSGPFQAPVHSPFHAAYPQQTRVNSRHMSLIDPKDIQPLGHQMGPDFNRLNSMISQAPSTAAGIRVSGGNRDPQAGYPSLSHNVDDFMSTGMANLNLKDHQPQISTHSAPTTSLLSDRQVGLRPTDQKGNNSNLNRPPPASTSQFNSQPSLSVGPNSKSKEHDRSDRINKDSFNEHNYTLRDSYNDNSLVDIGNHSADDHSNGVDEDASLEEILEITSANEGKSTEKKKKKFQVPFFNKK